MATHRQTLNANRPDERTIDVMPTKELFIDILTRDISLIPAIIDLVDNSADGAKRLRKNGSFKGLWVRIEISPEEFGKFIGDDIRLQPVMLLPEVHIQQLLEYYMGKNSPSRQDFIIDNLKVELDLAEVL